VDNVLVLATDEFPGIISTEGLDSSGYPLDLAISPKYLHKIQVVFHKLE
jgi:hypothetical protein